MHITVSQIFCEYTYGYGDIMVVMKSAFITFEGIEGGGKSTQVKNVVEWLESLQKTVVRTREPGGSPGAEEIRRLLVEGDAGRWSPETELLLFKAARRDHLEKTIEPALQAGKVVISDRFVDSTRVYQGATRGDLRKLVDTLHELMIGREPDLTIIIDMDPKIALNRALARLEGDAKSAKENRFESMGLEFQQKLRAGYKEIAVQNASRCALIDGNGSPEEVFVRIQEVIRERLQVEG